MIRSATDGDAGAIVRIYNHYVVNTVVTFEETPLTAADYLARMAAVRSSSLPWLVAEEGGQVLGYAYAARWKDRTAYRFTVETTIYLDQAACGRGLGSSLYGALFTLLEEQGVHAVIGGITLPNAPSVALHERFGMVQVAHFRETGFKFNRWLDVGYWEMTFPAARA